MNNIKFVHCSEEYKEELLDYYKRHETLSIFHRDSFKIDMTWIKGQLNKIWEKKENKNQEEGK